MMKVEEYDFSNPNHARSVLSTFVDNLERFHDPLGEGYEFVFKKVLELTRIGKGPMAHSYIFMEAVKDFNHLPPAQKEMMKEKLKILQSPDAAAETRDLVKTMLEN
jgi:hypothetical protein